MTTGAARGGDEDGADTLPVYGRALLPLWQIEPGTRFINHGAFGATPRLVSAEQARWRERMEANTARFFMSELPGLLRRTAVETAPFLGTAPERLAFVENVSAGTSAVLRSLDFAPGDEILTTDHVYNAVRNLLRHVAERTGAVLREAALPVPVTGADAVIDAIRGGLGERTRLVVIDHVTSASALEFPVREIVALCRARGVPVLVDGAHAPGLLDLAIDQIGADWYVGNCHKWLCAPKGAAFIAVAERPTQPIHPLVISHAYGQGFAAEFDKVGTRDPSSWLSIPEAIRFHESLGGPKLRARNRALARQLGDGLESGFGLERAGRPELQHALVAFQLPGDVPATREHAVRLRDILYDRHGFEAAITTVRGALNLRISVHAYNEAADYDGLGEAVLEAIGSPGLAAVA